MRFAPVMTINAKQAKRIRHLLRITSRQSAEIAELRQENEILRGDAETLALMVPKEGREVAMAIVRDRRRIVRLEETT